MRQVNYIRQHPETKCRTDAVMNTLPDYLQHNLDIVLVGLNPSLPSVEAGRYFASPRNRFWRALNRSGIRASRWMPRSTTRCRGTA